MWLDAPSNCLTGYESTEDSAFEYSLAGDYLAALISIPSTNIYPQFFPITTTNIYPKPTTNNIYPTLITDTAVQAIALAIGVNTTLQYLNISNNNLFNVSRHKSAAMSSESLVYLKHGIQENGKNHGHLHTLNLTRNPLRLTTPSSSSLQTPLDVADMVRDN